RFDPRDRLPQCPLGGCGPALSTSILLDEQGNRRPVTVMGVSGSCRQFLCETASRLGVATSTHMLKGLGLWPPAGGIGPRESHRGPDAPGDTTLGRVARAPQPHHRRRPGTPALPASGWPLCAAGGPRRVALRFAPAAH